MFCNDFAGIMTKQIKEILKEIVDIKRKRWGWKVLRYESWKNSKASKHHESERHSVVSDSLRPHGVHSPWNSLGQHTGAGNLSLLQMIFPTQRLKPGLPHCRQSLYQFSHKGSPRIGEGSLFPLQWIFLTQELNRGLLNCRRILYQLSYQGSLIDIISKELTEENLMKMSVSEPLPDGRNK